MKHTYLLLFSALIFMSCGKIGMEEATVQMIADEPAVTLEREFPIVYLHNWYDQDQVTKTYVTRLGGELNHGKLQTTNFDPDYELRLNSVKVRESVWKEAGEQLSRLTTDVTFELVHVESGQLVETFTVSETNADEYDRECDHVIESGGVGGSFDKHAREVRKKVKKIIRQHQDNPKPNPSRPQAA